MPELTPEIVAQVVQTATSGAAEASAALARSLDAAGMQVTVGQPGTLAMATLPEGFDGPGLALVFSVGSVAVLALLPEKTGIPPGWCADPDPTGQSKLATLAQELGMILLPEDFMPDDSKAGWVKTLAGAIARGGVADGAAILPLELVCGEKHGALSLVWPATKPAMVIGAGVKPPPAAEKPKAPAAKPSPPKPAAKAPARPAPRKGTIALEDLPPYSKSLLRIKVPVVVTLAKKRQPLGRIVELGPGSIIQFEKSCEEMLELEVGRRPVATGEAVKVGDKFGLRITSMVLPEERFRPLRPGSAK